MKRRGLYVLATAALGAVIGVPATAVSLTPALERSRFSLDSQLNGFWPFLLAALGCWIVFALYWEVAAKNIAAPTKTERIESRRFHLFLANFALLRGILPIRGIGRFMTASAYWMVERIAFEVGGTSLAISARNHVGRNWSGIIANQR